MNPGLEMIGALYISNFDIFGAKLIDNQGAIKKFDILHCPFEKNAIQIFLAFVKKIPENSAMLIWQHWMAKITDFKHVKLAKYVNTAMF